MTGSITSGGSFLIDASTPATARMIGVEKSIPVFMAATG